MKTLPPNIMHRAPWKQVKWGFLLKVTGLLLALCFPLAWVSNGAELRFSFQGISGWLSFLLVEILAALLIYGIWKLLQSEQPPAWLGALVIGAALLRLAAGAFWFITLPALGHNSPAEQGGYVMADASQRDLAAWKLAQSNKPLWTAFQNNRTSDQYGGLLSLSALVYRYLGGETHQPLLIIVITAAFSALGVLFTWAMARRAWDEKIAGLAAWGVALYPEAVLLGSSQMREAFMVTLTVAAFYGLLCYQKNRSWNSLAWVLASIVIYLLFSPPFAALLVGMLALTAIFTTQRRFTEFLHRRWFWLALVVVCILVLIGLWLALRQFTPEGMYNPIEMLSWWLRKSAGLQAYLSRHASGWIQKVFKSTPEWMHLPLLIIYGVVQPFLPAALIANSSALIWRLVAVWRSIGWTVLLAFLIYAPLLLLRRNKSQHGGPGHSGGIERRFAQALNLIIWASILIASFRGGGDMWDNPRYRATFAGLQIALAAWAWWEYRRAADPLLRRALISLGCILLWFLPWYLRRYSSFTWPVVDLFKTVALGLATASLLILCDKSLIWNRSNKSQQAAESGLKEQE